VCARGARSAALAASGGLYPISVRPHASAGRSASLLGGMLRAQSQDPTGAALARLALRRTLLWSHVALGFVTLFVCIYAFSLRGSGPALILMAAPVLAPYAISARYSWQLYTWQGSGPSPLRVAAFLALLILGAFLVDSAILGAFGQVDPMTLLQVLCVQVFGYLWGANWLLDII
jgi:hypothetical protein